jgi:hypothetical protein
LAREWQRQLCVDLGQRVGQQQVWGGCVGHQTRHDLVWVLGRIPHHNPAHQGVYPTGIGMKRASHCGIDDLIHGMLSLGSATRNT